MNNTQPKITVLRGLPGSGKSTRAALMLKNDPRLVRVNKDDLRNMLFKDCKWSHANEGIVLDVEEAIVIALVADGKNLVIDNTNLNKNHVDKWEAIAKRNGYDFEIIDMQTSVEECIIRDSKREGKAKVGSEVIMNMAMKAGLAKKSDKPWIGVDLDGTLADITVRRDMSVIKTENGKEKLNYGIFFDPENIKYDGARDEIIAQVNQFKKDHNCEMVILSGRSDRTRAATIEWLKCAGVNYDRIIMRPDGNYIPDDTLKLQFLDNYLDASKCIQIWDDRPRVIRAWRSRGIKVIDVGNGEEF